MKQYSLKNKIILFTRYPAPGKSKTRLIPVLGAAGAANLQRKMTEYILETLDSFKNTLNLDSPDIEIRYTGATEALMQTWLGNNYTYIEQGAGNLGTRMLSSFSDNLENGYNSVIVIGADCPSITPKILHDAFTALKSHNAVLGPADDGGYYLIGLKIANSKIFNNITWGTSTVLADTTNNISQLNLKLHLLEKLSDIDEPADLPVWENIILTNN